MLCVMWVASELHLPFLQVLLLDEKSKVPLPYPYEMINRLNAMSGRKH